MPISKITAPQERWVTCPHCGGASLFAPSNTYRPFCGARCKGADLGAWASELFSLPAQSPGHDPEFEHN
jgi:uncharacterized protein